MNCKKCGNYIENPSEVCPYCGELNSVMQNNNFQPNNKQKIFLIIITILSAIIILEIMIIVFKPSLLINDYSDNTNNDIINNEKEPIKENKTTIIEEEKEKTEDKINSNINTNTKTNENKTEVNETEINNNASDDDVDSVYNYYGSSDYDFELTEDDMKKYFEEISTIVNIIDVSKEKNILTEKEVVKFLEKRGFKNGVISSNYDMEGNVTLDSEITNPSNKKHPLYDFYYSSETTGLWTVSIIANEIYAYPAERFLKLYEEGKTVVPIELSESKTVRSFDCIGYKYYITIPNKDVMDVRVVKKIDKSTLDNYKLY